MLRFTPLLLLLATVAPAQTTLRLPHILSDHSVLQRRAPIHIWGWSAPSEPIHVALHNQNQSTTANRFGEWSLWLNPEEAGGPFTLSVTGASNPPLTLTDILIGDVWVASGQSNMEMPLRGFPNSAVVKDADKEIASATLPQVRLLLVPHATTDVPADDTPATWTLCNPTTAADFSAVAFFYGRELNQREHVPIGLIDSTWGGTPAEAWTSLDGLASDASLMPVFSARAHFTDSLSRLTAIQAQEKREDEAARAAGQPLPQHPWHPAQASWSPAALYNGMIAPLTPYTIKGVIWYQGETNSALDRAPLYHRLFPALISDWRTQWHQGNFPFLYVQISNFSSPSEDWGTVRDAQRRTLDLRNTAMAVTLDVGDEHNVHPSDKQTVATRLALAARNLVYGESLESSGPLFRQANPEPSGIRVWFDHAQALKTPHLNPDTKGFELAGPDHKFVHASAIIEGNTVFVASPTLKDPRYVRYAWASFTDADLFNESNLPASTFTSE